MKQIVSRGHTRPLTEISFVEDGPERTLLVSSAHDKTPQIRLGETGDWLGSFHGHKGAVWSAKADRRSRSLAVTASGDFTAKLWCLTTGRELCELKHKHVVKTADFSTDTERIATGCQDGLMRVYNTCAPEMPPVEYRVASSVNDAISKLAWSTSEIGLLIVSKRSGALEKWDMRTPGSTGPVMSATVAGGDNIMDIDVSAAHNLIMVAAGRKVHAFSMNGYELVKEFDMPPPLNFKEEAGVALSPDGTRFIAGGSDLWLREFDFASGELVRTFKGHHGPVRCARYHPLGRVAASGSEDGTIRLWDLAYNATAASTGANTPGGNAAIAVNS